MPDDTSWKPIDDDTPRDVVVMTKILDASGDRMEQTLYQPKDKSVHLWFVPSGEMYVYYRPTHWRELTEAERDSEFDRARKRGADLVSAIDAATARLRSPDAR